MKVATNPAIQGAAFRNLVNDTINGLKSHDNQPEDLDPAPGRVVLSRKDMAAKGLKPIQFPRDWQWKDEVVEASVQFDPQSGNVQKADVQTERYYDSSYGKSASDFYTYSLEDKGTEQQFKVLRKEYWNTNNFRAEGTINKATGEISNFRYKEYAQTFPEALKEVVTTPAGIFLTLAAAGLAGAPGTLTGTLAGAAFGPTGQVAAAVIGGAAVAGALAYYKTKPW